MTAVYQFLYNYHSLAEVISFLKNRDFSQFYIGSSSAQIVTEETEEIYVYGISDHVIPEKTVLRMLDVLEHLHDYQEKAYEWLIPLDLQNDRYCPDDYKKLLPDEPDKVFGLGGIDFGIIHAEQPNHTLFKPYCRGHKPKKDTDGFLLTFGIEYYPLCFDVKFAYEGMRPYATEAWIM